MATAAGSPEGRNLPVLPGTLIHVTVERLPDGRDPHRAMWLWHAGPGDLSLDELWRAYLRPRFDIGRAFKLLKGTFGLTAAKVRKPPNRPTAGSGSSWPRTPSSCSPGLWPAGTSPALGKAARSRPAAGPGPGSPRVSQHPA